MVIKIQTRWGDNFYTIDHAACPGQKFSWHEFWRAICLRWLTSLW